MPLSNYIYAYTSIGLQICVCAHQLLGKGKASCYTEALITDLYYVLYCISISMCNIDEHNIVLLVMI